MQQEQAGGTASDSAPWRDLGAAGSNSHIPTLLDRQNISCVFFVASKVKAAVGLVCHSSILKVVSVLERSPRPCGVETRPVPLPLTMHSINDIIIISSEKCDNVLYFLYF